jgi:hypothetical protein
MGSLRTRRQREPSASRVGPSHLVAAAAILALLVMPVAFASPGDPAATKSASLTKQVKQLKKRVAALEAKPDQVGQVPASLPPSGPAGGVLTGVYPNPGLAASSVDTGQIADGAVSGEKISPRTITTGHFKLADSASLNFPTINAGQCSALTHDGPGSVSGSDHVLITPPSNFADTFTLTAKQEPLNDAVIFVACNVFGGGGSADPDGANGAAYRYLVIALGS